MRLKSRIWILSYVLTTPKMHSVFVTTFRFKKHTLPPLPSYVVYFTLEALFQWLAICSVLGRLRVKAHNHVTWIWICLSTYVPPFPICSCYRNIPCAKFCIFCTFPFSDCFSWFKAEGRTSRDCSASYLINESPVFSLPGYALCPHRLPCNKHILAICAGLFQFATPARRRQGNVIRIHCWHLDLVGAGWCLHQGEISWMLPNKDGKTRQYLKKTADFPMGVRGQGFLKLGLTGKTRGKGGSEYLGLFHVICHQFPWPIEQWVHICPNVPLTAEVLVASFIALHIPSQIQFKLSLGFPKPIPARSDNYTLLLGHLPLLSPFVEFVFMSSEFS